MSLLVLLDSHGTDPGTSSEAPSESDLLQALLDAIHGEDDRIAGMRMTRLTAPLEDTDAVAIVESTLGFGENTDGTSTARLLIGGEVIEADGRVDGPGNFRFTGLDRGLEGSEAKLHPPGTLVFDIAQNTSARDHVRRGLFVDTASGADLDVIGRNLGLKKCIGLTDAQWREIIRSVAYLPKQPVDAFRQALTALLGDATQFAITEKLLTDPWKVFVEILVEAATSLQGRFVLNSGEAQLTTGLTSVDTSFTIIEPSLSDTLTELGLLPGDGGQPPLTIEGRSFSYPASGTGTLVAGVYLDTPITRMGVRDGFTNYASGGSVAGNTITLGSSPGAASTAVLVDYTAWSAHYLAQDETTRDDADYYAYLADPLLAARCLLEQVRAAGIQVELSARIT